MSNIKDFIGVFENVMSQDFCNRTIKFFEEANSKGFGLSRQTQDKVRKTLKDDVAVYIPDERAMRMSATIDLCRDFQALFWTDCYKPYAEEYNIIADAAPHSIYEMKVQKTNIGGGYHVWHFEADNRENSPRLFAYTVYLNDVEEGGETEFLYYPRRIKAKAGTVCIFPCSFTHTHRGNPPISNEKYIITGWVEF